VIRSATNRGVIGIRAVEPVFAVRDLEAAMAFYERLGFNVRRHDAGYGYAEREGLRIHLRASPEIDPSSSYSEIYLDTAEVDQLHEEWRTLGLLPVRSSIGPEIKTEVRRRWEAGEPVGLISEFVQDKPWGIREFSIRDPDNNQIRIGRPSR
jgi:catechol 2,3-dioxygenase-like lactoylglutathione lyase family enzyme